MWRKLNLAVKSVRYVTEDGWDRFVGVGKVWEEEEVTLGEDSSGLFVKVQW